MAKILDKFSGKLNLTSAQLQALVPVNISNVARWYFSEAEIDRFSLRDQFPCALSPFDTAFYEYDSPTAWKVLVNKTWKMHKRPVMPGERVGILMHQTKYDIAYTGADPVEGSQLNRLLTESNLDIPVRFTQDLEIYFTDGRDFFDLFAVLRAYLDELGQLTGVIVRHISQQLDSWPSDLLNATIRVYIFPMYFSTSLMSCRNVCVVEPAQPRQQPGKPATRQAMYRTIHVDESLRRGGGKAGSNQNSVITALHIARGHWKDYRDGHGLFGKIRGRWWWTNMVKKDGKSQPEYLVK